MRGAKLEEVLCKRHRYPRYCGVCKKCRQCCEAKFEKVERPGWVRKKAS